MRSTATILIVEDDETQCYTICRLLQARGYSTATVSNGKEALAYLLDEDPVDAIVLDILMPDMNGYELLKIKAGMPVSRAVPVILFSSIADRVTASYHSVQAVVSKSDLEGLLEAVERCCGSSAGAIPQDGLPAPPAPPPSISAS